MDMHSFKGMVHTNIQYSTTYDSKMGDGCTGVAMDTAFAGTLYTCTCRACTLSTTKYAHSLPFDNPIEPIARAIGSGRRLMS